jgi:predicted peptidase
MRIGIIALLTALQCNFCHVWGDEPVGLDSIYEVKSVSREGQASYAYRVMRPATETGKVPLVVFLHGAGERGGDNLAQLKFLPAELAKGALRQEFPCFVLAPQCASDQQWVNAPWGDKACSAMAAEPSVMLANAIAALGDVRKDPRVDLARVYLVGLSMGGYGAWELAIRQPDWFAAVVPICGGGDEALAAKLKDTPLWAVHGEADSIVWPERSKRMVEAISAAGGKPKWTLLAGVGHNAWDYAFARTNGVITWMFSQHR